jgi:hypothetical protein
MRLYDDESTSPGDPPAREPHPEQAVPPRERDPLRASPLQHLELVTQREQLKLENATCAGASRIVRSRERRTYSISKAYRRSGHNINRGNENGIFSMHNHQRPYGQRIFLILGPLREYPKRRRRSRDTCTARAHRRAHRLSAGRSGAPVVHTSVPVCVRAGGDGRRLGTLRERGGLAAGTPGGVEFFVQPFVFRSAVARARLAPVPRAVGRFLSACSLTGSPERSGRCATRRLCQSFGFSTSQVVGGPGNHKRSRIVLSEVMCT